MSSLDFSSLSDDQLVDLIRAALQEVVRRGPAVEAAARSAGMDEAEKARIARDASEREAARLRAEEAARIAAEAAERVRRQATEAAEKKENDAVQSTWTKKAEIARKAREIFADASFVFTGPWFVKVWKRGAEQRVFWEFGFDCKLATYYHTGNARTKPGTLEIHDSDCKKQSAAIAAFSKELASHWNELVVEVPADPHRTEPYWVIFSKRKGEYFAGGEYWKSLASATGYPTPEAAEAALETARDHHRGYKGEDKSSVLEVQEKVRKVHYYEPAKEKEAVSA